MDEREKSIGFVQRIDLEMGIEIHRERVNLSLDHTAELSLAKSLSKIAFSPDVSFRDRLRSRLLSSHPVSCQGHTEEQSSIRSIISRCISPLATRIQLYPIRYAFILVLLFSITIFHQPVWAALQRLLGFVPHVGFVQVENARILSRPSIVEKEGVTVIVDQVLALPERTIVVFHSLGLPSDGQLREVNSLNEFNPKLWPQESYAWNLSLFMQVIDPGAARLEFGPVPMDVTELTLTMNQLPGLPSGAAPGDWEIPISLKEVGLDDIDQFLEPYAPENARVFREDIGLVIDRVAHTADETAILYRMVWSAEDCRPLGLNDLQLEDNLGNLYYPRRDVLSVSPRGELIRVQSIGESEEGKSFAWESMIGFPALEHEASQITLSAKGLEFAFPVQDEFVIDLGSIPAFGSSWPLDVSLDVAGFPVHITRASLVEEDEIGPRLEFHMDPIAEMGGRRLTAIGLSGNHPFVSSSGCWDGENLFIYLGLLPGRNVPVGQIKVRVDEAFVEFVGPWEVSWTVPVNR